LYKKIKVILPEVKNRLAKDTIFTDIDMAPLVATASKHRAQLFNIAQLEANVYQGIEKKQFGFFLFLFMLAKDPMILSVNILRYICVWHSVDAHDKRVLIWKTNCYILW